MRRRWITSLLCLWACGPRVGAGPEDGIAEVTGMADTTGSPPESGPVESGPASGDEDFEPERDYPPQEQPQVLDVLFVIDNSAQTADMQLRLGQSMGAFVEQLSGTPRSVQVMFTTTDVGNPSCTPFQPPGYEPAMGAPVASGCNARIDAFTGLGSNPDQRTDVCSALCPVDMIPSDAFVAFDTETGEHNIPGGSVVETLACLLPQGINGCGFEAPLEAMLRALDPTAAHNSGDRPFLRDDADLAIVLLTNETDCSVEDFGVMDDPSYWNINPQSGNPQPSSALCWNAGVECTGPDADGVFSECVAVDGPLHPVSRYAGWLAELRASGKRVTMVSIGGVPPVTGYAGEPPQEQGGGLDELVYRNWRASDLSPHEVQAGVSVEHLAYDLGIGPACTLTQGDVHAVRAIPNPRVVEVCRSLEDGGNPACCVESACGDYEAALGCLVGMATWIPPSCGDPCG